MPGRIRRVRANLVTTRAKLNIASLAASTLMIVGVFGHALGIPRSLEVLPMAVAWIPLVLCFVYIKWMKVEAAGVAVDLPTRDMARRRVIGIWVITVIFSLTTPWWMPAVSGTNLGMMANILIAVITVGIVSFIFGMQLRKMPKTAGMQPGNPAGGTFGGMGWVVVVGIGASIIGLILMLANPDRSGAVAELNRSGVAKALKGDFDGAIADLNLAIEQNPSAAALYYNRGAAKDHKGDLDAAMADYNRALELDAKYVSAYVNRGVIKARRKDFAGAIADYGRALEFDPQYVGAYGNRGEAKFLTGDVDGALADFNRALELDPKVAVLYQDRSMAKAKKGDAAGAAVDLAKARELESGVGK